MKVFIQTCPDQPARLHRYCLHAWFLILFCFVFQAKSVAPYRRVQADSTNQWTVY